MAQDTWSLTIIKGSRPQSGYLLFVGPTVPVAGDEEFKALVLTSSWTTLAAAKRFAATAIARSRLKWEEFEDTDLLGDPVKAWAVVVPTNVTMEEAIDNLTL